MYNVFIVSIRLVLPLVLWLVTTRSLWMEVRYEYLICRKNIYTNIYKYRHRRSLRFQWRSHRAYKFTPAMQISLRWRTAKIADFWWNEWWQWTEIYIVDGLKLAEWLCYCQSRSQDLFPGLLSPGSFFLCSIFEFIIFTMFYLHYAINGKGCMK